MRTVSMHRQATDTPALDAFALRGFRVLIGGPKFTSILERFKAQYGDAARLVILDALYRANPFNENDNTEMTKCYNLLDGYCRKFNVSIALVHHASKGNQSEKSVTDVGSGAGAISRCPDTHLTIRQHAEDGLVVVDARTRSFPPLASQSWRWAYPAWECSNVEPVLRNDSSGKRRLGDDKASDDVLDALADASDAMNLSQLAQNIDVDRERIRRVLEGLKAEGQVDEVERPGQGRWFVLAGQDASAFEDLAETPTVATKDDGTETVAEAAEVEADVATAATDDVAKVEANVASDDVDLVLELARPQRWQCYRPPGKPHDTPVA